MGDRRLSLRDLPAELPAVLNAQAVAELLAVEPATVLDRRWRKRHGIVCFTREGAA